MRSTILALSLLIVSVAVAAGRDRRVPPIPTDNRQSAAKIEFGRQLFYDADLSVDGTMSCATCHEQRHGFGDGNMVHGGVHGDPGRRNVPGLANVAWRRTLTWGDPRISRLEAQALVPIFGHDPVEMGLTDDDAELARRLGRSACYRRLFRASFPDTAGRIDRATVTRALAAFERTLVSHNSPADRGAVLRAAALVFARHCASCHAGSDYTDDRFHRLPGVASDKDAGLAAVTGRREDWGAFRTPSLRNVAVTGPWLHDGSALTLDAAIRAHGGDVGPVERAAVEAFLPALTDDVFLADPRYGLPPERCTAVPGRRAARETARSTRSRAAA